MNSMYIQTHILLLFLKTLRNSYFLNCLLSLVWGSLFLFVERIFLSALQLYSIVEWVVSWLLRNFLAPQTDTIRRLLRFLKSQLAAIENDCSADFWELSFENDFVVVKLRLVVSMYGAPQNNSDFWDFWDNYVIVVRMGSKVRILLLLLTFEHCFVVDRMGLVVSICGAHFSEITKAGHAGNARQHPRRIPQVCCSVVQCVAVCCSGLQWVAVCNIRDEFCRFTHKKLPHTATHCNTHCNTLQQTLQHTTTHIATHCNTLKCSTTSATNFACEFSVLQCGAVCCSVLQCVSLCRWKCSTTFAMNSAGVLQYVAVWCSVV